MDGAPAENGITIRQLTLENWELVCENYETMDDPQYVKERIEKGKMYGAFLEEELVAFAGIHAEGSIGMLQVLSPYQGRKIGKALETYMINISLEQGMTPYGQVKDGNDKSLRLQESLGLCLSRDMVYWMEAGD
ncbi:MAG: GNAT family N-acetyltransferase [Roseburia sp.]